MLLSRIRFLCSFNVVTMVSLMFFDGVYTEEEEPIALPLHNIRISKRMDIAVCVNKFEVHVNTLIQTSASLNMGAKFLADADLAGRSQCLRLCCETDNCDVFVYEEKTHGSCFLFECGPPSDFRCKFVNHANYTSAILDLSHPPPVASTQPPPTRASPSAIRPILSEHELDLDKLRVKTARNKGTPTTTSTTAMPPLGVRAADILTTKATQGSKCTRFQFPCKNGECIAIYDACNGIPQCSDGSDEGPECPASESNSVGGIQDSYPKTPKEAKKLPELPVLGRNREDPMTAPKNWPPRGPDHDGAYADTESRIFSHKNGLQVPATNIQYPYQSPPDYLPLPPDPYAQQSAQSWMPQQRPSYSNWPQQPPAPPQMLPPEKPYGPSQNWAPPQTSLNMMAPDYKSDVLSKGKDDLPAEGHLEDSTSEEDEEIVTTEPPRKQKARKHKKLKDKHAEHHDRHEHEDVNEKLYQAQVSSLHNSLTLEMADHDGLSDRPSGAVLSLTLGVIITAALAVLIVCRVRVAGRRVRRHHPKGSGNYEADFLVNGMYL